ncbi:MAG: DegT/DnrJ/EryC1/StrS family aminotransferase, partial [Clostridium sp.]|nr:DegT/DnrJ/EryC1/StrS family aminotransferase [Clostridium sp.]
SFTATNITTTRGGGMIVSENQDYLKLAKHLTTQAKSDELYYTHDMVGYNYRMTNLQAALGLAQLEQLERFIDIKLTNYNEYGKILENIKGLSLLSFRDTVRSNHWFYGVFCDELYPLNRDQLICHLAEHKVQSRPIWGLINEQLPYQKARAYQIERAGYYWKRVVNIPCSTNLSIDDVQQVGALLDIENR